MGGGEAFSVGAVGLEELVDNLVEVALVLFEQGNHLGAQRNAHVGEGAMLGGEAASLASLAGSRRFRGRGRGRSSRSRRRSGGGRGCSSFRGGGSSRSGGAAWLLMHNGVHPEALAEARAVGSDDAPERVVAAGLVRGTEGGHQDVLVAGVDDTVDGHASDGALEGLAVVDADEAASLGPRGGARVAQAPGLREGAAGKNDAALAAEDVAGDELGAVRAVASRRGRGGPGRSARRSLGGCGR
mmetsp:Transcript_22700/g.86006  ORF Transcript_22700/g.86006 Transcript_22700/m.86006 type:complete len:242 (+) Transcript_22700:306-1031(+)